MRKIELDDRLKAAAELVKGSFAADIGTDHGMLPVYLCTNGICEKAVASDINAAPLSKAKANIRSFGLEDKIETVLTDGLNGIEKYPVTDIVIAGMGGLTIIDILSAASFVKEKKTRLILQPMQHLTELRTYLFEEGYRITEEKLAESEGRIYQVVATEFDGVKRTAPPIEILLGKYTIEHRKENPELFGKFCEKHIMMLGVKAEGLSKGNLDNSREIALIEELKKLIKTEA